MNKPIRLLLLAIVALIAVIAWRSNHESAGVAPEPPAKPARGAVKSAEPLLPITPTDSRVQEPAAIAPTPDPPPLVAKPPESTIAMHIRIVDRATSAPIPGAVIVRARDEGATLESDAEGRCELTALLSVTRAPQFSNQSVIPQGFCRVRADGFSYGEFHEEEGHESADKALEVKLDKAATLAVALMHRPLPDAGVYEVRASWQAQDLVQNPGSVSMDLETMHSEAACDAQGIAVVEMLPANVPILVTVLQGKQLVRGLSEPLKLEAGLRRELDIDLGGACHLTGRVVDSNGAAAPNLAVWLAPKGKSPIWEFESWHEKSCVAMARSDASGRFDLGQVPPGQFWIGPAPSELAGSQHKFKNVLPKGVYELDFAAVAALVEITAEDRAKEVDVHIERGLFINGIVLDPNGNPTPGTATVMAHSTSGHNSRATCGPDGKFSIGPLVRESYKVHAYYSGAPTSVRYAESLEVDAAAGAADVVLALRQVDDLTLKVVDRAGGSGVRAKVILSYLDGSRTMFFDTDDAGVLHPFALLPGRLSVSAASSDGRVGIISSLDLTSDGRAQVVEVLLAPGAKLKVRAADGSRMTGSVYVYWDAILVGFSDLDREGKAGISVPPGEVTVRAYLEGRNEKCEQTVAVAAGEEREVVFGP